MMLLPETTRTPAGFSVEGASSEMLEQLLDEYGYELKTRSPRVFESMLPGLSRGRIEDELGAIGMTPSAEALVWWQWRNGLKPGAPGGLRHPQLSLADSIAVYRTEGLGTEPEDWNPDWIRIAGGGNSGVAMSCRRGESPPRVRYVSTFSTGTQDDEDLIHQVVSLCTPVTWWLLAIEKGWSEWDPFPGTWGWDESRYPTEWYMTNLV